MGKQKTDLSPNAAMPGTVRATLDTGPKVGELGHVHASLHDAGCCHLTGGIVDLAFDAMIVNFVARSQGVDIIGKGAVLDAAVLSGPVTPEAEDRV